MKTNNIPTTLSEGLDSRINYRYSSRMFVNVAIWLIVAIASAVILFSADIDQKSPSISSWA